MKYVTSNRGKFEEAVKILAPLELQHVPFDIKEIQGDPDEVIQEKIRHAIKEVDPPFIIEDVSLFCPALGGLPGPYVKHFLSCLGVRGFAELLQKYDDRRAEILCIVAYVPSKDHITIMHGRLHGTVVVPKQEVKVVRWQDFIIPEGETRTLGEIPEEEYHIRSARGLALQRLKELLKLKNSS